LLEPASLLASLKKALGSLTETGLPAGIDVSEQKL
jgi:hypothetical protein